MKRKGLFIFSLALAFVLSLSSEKLFCQMRLDVKSASSQQQAIEQSVCCETACPHCEENSGAASVPLTAKCLEDSRQVALTPSTLAFEPREPVTVPFLTIFITPALTAVSAFDPHFSASFSPPFFSGRVLHSVMLHS